MKVGDYVKYNAENGSTGKIVAKHFNLKGHFYVRWVYGLDVKGSPITSTSGGLTKEMLVPITKEQYEAVKNGKAFGKS